MPTADNPETTTSTEDGLTFPVIEVAHLDRTPLVLSFEPEALREHFEQDMDMNQFTDLQLATVGLAALGDDRIYEAFHDVLKSAMETLDKPATLAEVITAAENAAGPSFVCAYTITSLIDDHAEAVTDGEVTVHAVDQTQAGFKAAHWVRENDYHYDERIDPRVNITDIAALDQED